MAGAKEPATPRALLRTTRLPFAESARFDAPQLFRSLKKLVRLPQPPASEIVQSSLSDLVRRERAPDCLKPVEVAHREAQHAGIALSQSTCTFRVTSATKA